jgi:hypothetical protein
MSLVKAWVTVIISFLSHLTRTIPYSAYPPFDPTLVYDHNQDRKLEGLLPTKGYYRDAVWSSFSPGLISLSKLIASVVGILLPIQVQSVHD